MFLNVFLSGRLHAQAFLPESSANSKSPEESRLSALSPAVPEAGKLRWWKGNLHTHTLWSDGDSFPETVVEWYKTNDYHFLAISDHNIMLEGPGWLEIRTNSPQPHILKDYLNRYGDKVEMGELEGKQYVRLKMLSELSAAYHEKDRFLLIPSEEITDRYLIYPVHMNVTNPRELIKPQGGSNVFEVMQNNVNAVLSQRQRTGTPMFPHVNHPNFGWGIMAEDIIRLKGEHFFEVYNGHPAVRNEGDKQHPSTDRMWDIILTRRLAEKNSEPLFGLAVDDAHHYHDNNPTNSNPGRGWIMVQSPKLAAPEIINALEKGAFYASSGVSLKDIRMEKNVFSVQVEAQAGVTYLTRFIGTRKGYDPKNTPVLDASGNRLPITHTYSADVGQVFAEAKGDRAEYKLKGNELYLRAKIISSKPKVNGYATNEVEVAWTQPVFFSR